MLAIRHRASRDLPVGTVRDQLGFKDPIQQQLNQFGLLHLASNAGHFNVRQLVVVAHTRIGRVGQAESGRADWRYGICTRN